MNLIWFELWKVSKSSYSLVVEHSIYPIRSVQWCTIKNTEWYMNNSNILFDGNALMILRIFFPLKNHFFFQNNFNSSTSCFSKS